MPRFVPRQDVIVGLLNANSQQPEATDCPTVARARLISTIGAVRSLRSDAVPILREPVREVQSARRGLRVRPKAPPMLQTRDGQCMAERGILLRRSCSRAPGDEPGSRLSIMSAGSMVEYTVRNERGERVPHILVVAYLFPPSDAINVRRPSAFRNAFDALGVRTTVLAQRDFRGASDDDVRGVIRAGDLRTRIATQYQSLTGYRAEPLDVRTRPRWWTRYIVPDVSAVSWMPDALRHLRRLLRNDRPDGVFTTSPPESAHLLGAVARRAGVPWIADFRDGWMFDPPNPRPALTRLDTRLERWVVRSADIVTAINEPIADDFRRRFGARSVHVSNGFDRAALASATDESATLDPRRFSIVYTGTLGADSERTPRSWGRSEGVLQRPQRHAHRERRTRGAHRGRDGWSHDERRT